MLECPYALAVLVPLVFEHLEEVPHTSAATLQDSGHVLLPYQHYLASFMHYVQL